MYKIYIIRKIINFFDFFQQKKIFNILKKKIKTKAILFDVGAHHGESIENFKKNFNFFQIHSFEASKENFNVLNRKYKDLGGSEIILNNYGLSDKNQEFTLNEFDETSSSTLSRINEKSKYFQRKFRILGNFNNQNYYKHSTVKLDLLDNYVNEKNINRIDLLKIDTEGHEYFVLKGSLKSLSKIKFIYFEHHYDDMLEKGYTFSKIHKLLIKNNFKKIFKSKMYFRKTFEYIYENSGQI